MASITQVTLKNGAKIWKADVIKKVKGKVVFRRTFQHKAKSTVQAWADELERDLKKPGGVERQILKKRVGSSTICDLIERYERENDIPYGRSKADYIQRLKRHPFTDKHPEDLRAADYVSFARDLKDGRGIAPVTVSGYIGTMHNILILARRGWGIPIDLQEIDDARYMMRELGYTGKSKRRDRRPELHELDDLMEFSLTETERNPRIVPMAHLIAFAIFSGRREAEITRIQRRDFENGTTVTVHDMKHPRGSRGNHREMWVLDQARVIEASHARLYGKHDLIFPYHPDTVSRKFTEYCRHLEIKDLHFHDLRHECLSWLAEQGWSTPKIKKVSGHVNLQTLDRYLQLDHPGDKYEEWPWLEVLQNMSP